MKNTFAKLLVVALAFCSVSLYAEITPAQVQKKSSAQLVGMLVASANDSWDWFKATYDALPSSADKSKLVVAAQAALNKLIQQNKKGPADACAKNVNATGANVSTTSSGDFTIINKVNDISVPHTPVLSARASLE